MDELISRQVLDLWNRYKPTIAVDAMEYDRELKKLLSTNLAEVGAELISRQAAIDALDEIRHALWEIDIPSPTVPEYVEHHEQVQSVWKLLDKKQKELYVLQSVQPEPCEDAVSRQTLKDGFTEMCNLICPYSKKQQHVMCGSCLMGTAFDVLEATPPVTPKQRTGKWILDRSGACCCSECIEPCASYVMMKPRDKFCKMCGSRNEVTT